MEDFATLQSLRYNQFGPPHFPDECSRLISGLLPPADPASIRREGCDYIGQPDQKDQDGLQNSSSQNRREPSPRVVRFVFLDQDYSRPQPRLAALAEEAKMPSWIFQTSCTHTPVPLPHSASASTPARSGARFFRRRANRPRRYAAAYRPAYIARTAL